MPDTLCVCVESQLVTTTSFFFILTFLLRMTATGTAIRRLNIFIQTVDVAYAKLTDAIASYIELKILEKQAQKLLYYCKKNFSVVD
jgi:hypothetical protein